MSCRKGFRSRSWKPAISESHNHRIAEVGWGLWAHLVPPLLKQSHPEQVAEDHVQVGFEDLQSGDPTQPLSSLWQGSMHSTEGLPDV